LTVQGNVEFGLKEKGAQAAERVRQVLAQVRLEGKSERWPSELSGGERQRVALARAIVLQPDVLLLDEPLSALDPQLRKQVRSELRDLQRHVGVTFLFVTHDQEEALSMSDQIAVMNAGVVEQVGTPREVYRQPKTKFVAVFMGSMNWIDGVGVRPEAVRLSSQGRSAAVVGSQYLGSVLHLETKLESGETVTVQVEPGTSFEVGHTVHLSWNPKDEVRF
jgi:ABC-type Fe3+/spermidine/putrescine transport system ATPase subunit